MKGKFSLLYAAITCALALLLSGCFVRSAEELYALPLQSEAYYDLQSNISTLITDEQYSSPVSGSNQQPVQMADLDGDGMDEALVFANTGDAHPLKIFIFDRNEGKYENTCVIERDGTSFERVEYAQLDGVGGLEIVVGTQMGNQILQTISAFSLTNGEPLELLNASYSEFTIGDMDLNGNDDLFLLRFDAETRVGYGELYRCVDGSMEREPEVSMSAGVGSVRHILYGNLAEGQPAVFVGGMLDDGSTITDIFTFRKTLFSSISSSADLRFVSVPVRGYSVFATDIDGDGFVEIPNVVKLPGAVVTETSEDAYYIIRWYNYDPSSGTTLKENTFHQYASGWFLRLPEKMGRKFIVTRNEEIVGSRALTFSLNDGNDAAGDPIFTLYAFSGANRNILATADGRFLIGAKGETSFAAKLGTGAEKISLTQEELTAMFNFIRIDWDSGET